MSRSWLWRGFLGSGLMVFFLLSSVSLMAVEADFTGHYEQGLTLFRAGLFAEALPEFRRAFELEPGHTGANFHLGRCAFEVGDYETAVLAFERVLFNEPGVPRVLAELGRTYFQLRLFDMAEQYFREALAAQPPVPVRDRLVGFLAEIERLRQRHFFSGTLTFSLMHDTNARVSPEDDLIATQLGDVVLGEPFRTQRDWITSTAVNLDYRYKHPDSSHYWLASFLGYSAFYEDAGDLDLQYVEVTAGPGWQRGALSLSLTPLLSILQKDYGNYLWSYGAVGRASWRYSRHLLGLVEARLEDRSYFEDENQGRDGVDFQFSLGPTWGDDGRQFSLRTGYERLNAADRVEAYDAWFVEGNGTMALGRGFYLFGGYAFENKLYDRENPLFAERRAEREHRMTAGLRKLIGRRLAVTLSHTYTKTNANIELYEYDRNVTALALSAAF